MCLSQDKFARRLGFARRTVGNAERGTHSPSLALRRALDDAWEKTSAIQRGRFLAAGPADDGAVPGAQGLSPTLESVELLRRAEASDLGAGALEQLEDLVEQLGVEYFAVPPAQFRETVLSWRRYVGRLLEGKLTLGERRHLYAVAGWLSGLVAEASLALNDHAEPHCATALSLAQEVGDTRLAGWVRGTQAQVALYAGDPRDAVAFAQAGRQVAPIGSAALVRVCALEARAHARRGDLAEAEHGLSRAVQALDVRSEPETRSFFSFDEPYVPYYAGTRTSGSAKLPVPAPGRVRPSSCATPTQSPGRLLEPAPGSTSLSRWPKLASTTVPQPWAAKLWLSGPSGRHTRPEEESRSFWRCCVRSPSRVWSS